VSSANRRSQRISIPQLIRRHYVKVILIGLLTSAVLVPAVFMTSTQSYTAQVELRIDPQTNSVIPGAQGESLGGYYSAYVLTQKFKILKKANVQKALEMATPEAREAITGDTEVSDRMVESIINQVSVNPARDTLILTIELSSESPVGLAEFLNNLVQLYLDEIKNELKSQTTNQLDYSEQMKTDLQNRIASLNAQIRQVSESLASGNFAFDDVPYKAELKIQEQTSVVAENDRILKEKQYNEFVKNLYRSNAGLDSLVEQRLASDSLFQEQKRQLFARIDVLSGQLANLSAQNSSRKEIEDNIARVQAQVQDVENKARDKARKAIENENAGSLEKQRLELYNQYIVAKEYEDAVKKAYANVQGKYANASKQALVGQQLTNEVNDLKMQLARIETAQSNLQGERLGSGFVAVENWAKPPVLPDKSNLSKNLAGSLAFSFLWIIIVVVVFEVLDKRIKSAEELKLYTGIRPSWPISHHQGPLLRVSLEERESVPTKAIRSLATRINQERQTYQVKVVTFAGVTDRSGTTDILINCAHAMTDHCDQILVVDFNLTRSAIATKIGVPLKSQPTVKQLEVSPIESIVFRDQERNVDVLSIRNLDRLENKIVDRVLDLARERYDLILVDGAPILRSSQTEHLFFQSDAVVFVVRGNVCTYPDLKHTLEIAEKFGVQSAALVLNWWKRDKKLEKAEKFAQDSYPDPA